MNYICIRKRGFSENAFLNTRYETSLEPKQSQTTFLVNHLVFAAIQGLYAPALVTIP